MLLGTDSWTISLFTCTKKKDNIIKGLLKNYGIIKTINYIINKNKINLTIINSTFRTRGMTKDQSIKKFD